VLEARSPPSLPSRSCARHPKCRHSSFLNRYVQSGKMVQAGSADYPILGSNSGAKADIPGPPLWARCVISHITTRRSRVTSLLAVLHDPCRREGCSSYLFSS
jgi:hypothetical protein